MPEHAEAKRAYIAELCRLTPDQRKRLLHQLVESGRLTREREQRWTRYVLPKEPEP